MTKKIPLVIALALMMVGVMVGAPVAEAQRPRMPNHPHVVDKPIAPMRDPSEALSMFIDLLSLRGYRFFGLDRLHIAGRFFEFLGHITFFTLSRSSLLLMNLAMRFLRPFAVLK